MNVHGAPAGDAGAGVSVGVVLLAAGYGTRLAREMRADAAFNPLSQTPKPLLPLGGRVLLDHWLLALAAVPRVARIVVVTNAAHEHLYAAWVTKTAPQLTSVPLSVVSDGSSANDNRLGAVADMRIGVDALAPSSSAAPPDVILVIAGDTLLPGVDMRDHVARFSTSRADIGIFAYNLDDPADCVRRGMLRVSDDGKVNALVEKPQSVQESPSNLATAPVYILRQAACSSLQLFLQESEASGADMEKRDAPGFWLSWAIPKFQCALHTVPERIDIGHLRAYKDALVQFCTSRAPRRLLTEPAVGRALPRIGLLGNPSDGYGGRCIAVAIESEGYAEVVATPGEYFAVVPNPAHEMPAQYESLTTCAKYIADHGIHYGASQLVLAGVSSFVDAHMQQRWRENGSSTAEGAFPLMTNCHLSYSTTIPNRVGLSGSSALILATIRALARFHNTSMERIDPDIASWPHRVLRAEVDLLGITAGLMDRVAQVYEGCTYMDLANTIPIVERLDSSVLPKMWVAYAKGGKGGRHSGTVHSTLRERFDAGDRNVTTGMARLASLADQGRRALQSGTARDLSVLPALLRENWELRVTLVGRLSMAEENVRLVECAQRAGFAAKQTGSGGAIVCVPDPLRELSADELQSVERLFDEEDFEFRPVVPSRSLRWGA